MAHYFNALSKWVGKHVFIPPSTDRLTERMSCDCTIEKRVFWTVYWWSSTYVTHYYCIFSGMKRREREKSPHKMRLNLFAFATLNSKHVWLLDEQIDLFFHSLAVESKVNLRNILNRGKSGSLPWFHDIIIRRLGQKLNWNWKEENDQMQKQQLSLVCRRWNSKSLLYLPTTMGWRGF